METIIYYFTLFSQKVPIFRESNIFVKLFEVMWKYSFFFSLTQILVFEIMTICIFVSLLGWIGDYRSWRPNQCIQLYTILFVGTNPQYLQHFTFFILFFYVKKLKLQRLRKLDILLIIIILNTDLITDPNR